MKVGSPHSSFLRMSLVVLPFLAVPASCSSLALEEVAPLPASQPAVTAQADAPPPRPTQPDGYPNLNVPVERASPQFEADERRQLVEELTDLREKHATGEDSTRALSEAERLRLLGRSHGERALEGIEAPQ
ncbi:hypothetical protein [Chelativorans salis]|uniref:Uncharacterized protein n=1 Tax=Chelativorans salis TaxID=2978478 RepID=A0ABT2LMQ0_9HYPH|nr:hypothetical protein [Chelativorans sp. EGI FJ00035]MCT7375722.1 hypothetical protein [Chelativorans sp. EGI FJ00035]